MVRSASRRPCLISATKFCAKFDIDLAEARLDLLSFEFGGERLNELLVFLATGKKDFHPVADTLGHIIATNRVPVACYLEPEWP